MQAVVDRNGSQYMRKSFMDANKGRLEYSNTRLVGAHDADQGTKHVLRAWECPPCEGYAYAFMTELGSCDLATYLANHTQAANATLIPSLIDILGTCHGAGLFHGDIKPANFIVFGDEVKLGDFGLSDRFTSEGLRLTGTPGYRFLWHRSGTAGLAAAADWWSLAVIIAEIILGHKLFDATDLKELSVSSTSAYSFKNFLAARGVPGLSNVITRNLEAVSIPDMKRNLLTFASTAQQTLAEKRRCDDISAEVAPALAPAPKRRKSFHRNLRRKALKARLRQDAAEAVRGRACS
jgi:serine/threonine protein kinase